MSQITLDDVVLPFDLEWLTPYTWGEIAQRQDYAAQGELVVQANRKLAGRPIELTGSNRQGWDTRENLAALRAKANANDDPMTLYIGDAGYTVQWDRVSGEIEEKPLHPRGAAQEQAKDMFSVTLRFIVLSEIEASE